MAIARIVIARLLGAGGTPWKKGVVLKFCRGGFRLLPSYQSCVSGRKIFRQTGGVRPLIAVNLRFPQRGRNPRSCGAESAKADRRPCIPGRMPLTLRPRDSAPNYRADEFSDRRRTARVVALRLRGGGPFPGECSCC